MDGEEEEEEEKIDPVTLAPELFMACKTNDAAKVKELIEQETPVNYRDLESGWSPLHWASCNGNVELVELLLEKAAATPYQREKEGALVEEYALVGETVTLVPRGGAAAAAKDDDADAAEARAKDDDGDGDALPALSTLVMNTPLHWAAYKGHLRIAWLLLEKGYSPNDVDIVSNTPLHLAASNGHVHVVSCLLEDGADPKAKNSFRNTALDVSTVSEVRTCLAKAANAKPQTEEQIAEKHAGNLEAYYKVGSDLKAAVEGRGGAAETSEQIDKLKAAITAAEEVDISRAAIESGHRAVEALELKRELTEQIVAVQKNEPIVTQSAYTTLVNKLQRLVRQADALHVQHISAHLIEEGEFLIRKSHAEYWLKMGCKKLEPIDCACEDSVDDMGRLKASIVKAERMRAEEKLVADAKVLRDRLDAELELRRAVDAVPTVKLPIADAPKDYWDPDTDLGHIEENEGFPLPPDDGQYVWIPSASLKTMRVAAERLDAALTAAIKAKANEQLRDEATTKAKLTADELKQLERKDDEDKELSFAAAEKAAKKLKKKKKKK